MRQRLMVNRHLTGWAHRPDARRRDAATDDPL
jgi:hypothetical protein